MSSFDHGYCLKCHEHQKFSEGEVEPMLSISTRKITKKNPTPSDKPIRRWMIKGHCIECGRQMCRFVAQKDVPDDMIEASQEQ